MIKGILFSSFVQLKFAIAFETQVKKNYLQRKGKNIRKKNPSKISVQHHRIYQEQCNYNIRLPNHMLMHNDKN